MRKKVIAGNWKMNKTLSEATQFVEEVAPKLEQSEQVDAIICAPFTQLATLVEKAKKTHPFKLVHKICTMKNLVHLQEKSVL